MDKFYDLFKKYQDIIDLIKARVDSDGISRISQKELATSLNISQSLVSKCLIRLESSDKCIEKLGPGTYKVNHTDLSNYGPLSKVMKYCAISSKDEKISELSYTEQAKILNMTVEEIKMIHGYIQILVKIEKHEF